MKTMTRPAAGPPAADLDLPHGGRASRANRRGLSSQVPWLLWSLVGVAAGTVGLLTPALLPWLLLPVAPAVLLRAACHRGTLPCGRRLMRLFSVATLAAVAFQLAATSPTVVEIAVIPAATALYLGVVERLAMTMRD